MSHLSHSGYNDGDVEHVIFTGHEYDGDTDLTYANARYYPAKTGRWLSQDPVYLNLGFDLTDPQSLNSYSYTKNNPLKYVDPNGEFPVAFAVLALVAAGVFIDDIQPAQAPSSPVDAYLGSYAESKSIYEVGSSRYDQLSGLQQFGIEFGGGLLLGTARNKLKPDSGWLFRHEGANLGHTIQRHVGLSDRQLMRRLADQPQRSVVSTYTNLDVAEGAISTTINRNRDTVNNWLRNSDRATLTIHNSGQDVVGRYVNRSDLVVREGKSSTVVLQRGDSGGYHIKTSYVSE